MLAVLAAECAEAGLDVETTLEAVRAQVPETISYGILADSKYAVRGGRLPGWVRTIAELLRLTPIIYTRRDGKISLSGVLFGRRNRCRRFARYVARRVPDGAVEIGLVATLVLAPDEVVELAQRRHAEVGLVPVGPLDEEPHG